MNLLHDEWAFLPVLRIPRIARKQAKQNFKLHQNEL